ncbi:MAG: hypothetical protein GXP34_12485, partial [Actinobacteria bacterium]|nr:hypothetical protein [Actinomycetota bacterium]
AEDVAQQVFLVAFVHRDEFEFDREDARPWLCGIARNLCGRHFRTQWQIRHLTHRLPPPPIGLRARYRRRQAGGCTASAGTPLRGDMRTVAVTGRDSHPACN